MNERIKELISALGIKKVEFARKLSLSQPYISEMCSGKTRPSDRTISDICQKFNVNAQWLRTGEGEMFIKLSREDELNKFFNTLSTDDSRGFRRRLVSALARLDVEEWEMLEKVASKMVADMEKDKLLMSTAESASKEAKIAELNADVEMYRQKRMKEIGITAELASADKPVSQMTDQDIENELELIRRQMLLEREATAKSQALTSAEDA